MRKIIENIPHHHDDYECMWNGIEDIYMQKTRENIPDQFFFAMSGFCTFAYLKTNKASLKRMVSFGDGRTKQMYKLLSPLVGFDYVFKEYKTPESALLNAKKEIDSGYPVVIGALDMYYLSYYRQLYHKEHIPFHYVLMIGYDDELAKIYLLDCGRLEKQELSYKDLFLSWQTEYSGLSKPNTICAIKMTTPHCKKQIIKSALTLKAETFIHPKASFLGVSGMKKLAKELPKWESELGKEETDKIIKNMIYFFGSVPKLPNKLLGIKENDDITYQCSRDKMSNVLQSVALEYHNEQFIKASTLFAESGLAFNKLCNVFLD